MPHRCGMDRFRTACHAAGVDSTSLLPQAVDLHQRIRAIPTGRILLSRFGTLGMVGLSIVAIARFGGYANKPVATVTYVVVAVWSAVYLPVVATRDPIPRRVLGIDVAVVSAAAAVLPYALTEEAFA